MKYLTFCMGISDEKPAVHDKFANVKLDNGTHILIPILVCEGETLEELRTAFAQDAGKMFSFEDDYEKAVPPPPSPPPKRLIKEDLW